MFYWGDFLDDRGKWAIVPQRRADIMLGEQTVIMEGVITGGSFIRNNCTSSPLVSDDAIFHRVSHLVMDITAWSNGIECNINMSLTLSKYLHQWCLGAAEWIWDWGDIMTIVRESESARARRIRRREKLFLAMKAHGTYMYTWMELKFFTQANNTV